jgi:hypothetical protein
MKELIDIQHELVAPKGQRNTFADYEYRSCEDILGAVKTLLKKHNCTLIITDEIVLIGDRYYVKATCVLTNSTGEVLFTSAYARESLVKKGMDESQITGAASSYARKYALNGLFAIDDTKDSDTNESRKQETAFIPKAKSAPKPTSNPADEVQEVEAYCSICHKRLIMGSYGLYCPNYKETNHKTSTGKKSYSPISKSELGEIKQEEEYIDVSQIPF